MVDRRVIRQDQTKTTREVRRRALRFAYGLAVAALLLPPAAGAGDLSLLINGKAIHLEQRDGVTFNEANWGAGVQYDFTPNEDNAYVYFNASGFSDSFRNPSYYAGVGLAKRWNPFSGLPDFNADVGMVAFLMTRQDRNDGKPFPGVLPTLSLGTRRVSLNMTYIPKVEPKMVPLVFFQLKLGLGTAK